MFYVRSELVRSVCRIMRNSASEIATAGLKHHAETGRGSPTAYSTDREPSLVLMSYTRGAAKIVLRNPSKCIFPGSRAKTLAASAAQQFGGAPDQQCCHCHVSRNNNLSCLKVRCMHL